MKRKTGYDTCCFTCVKFYPRKGIEDRCKLYCDKIYELGEDGHRCKKPPGYFNSYEEEIGVRCIVKRCWRKKR